MNTKHKNKRLGKATQNFQARGQAVAKSQAVLTQSSVYERPAPAPVFYPDRISKQEQERKQEHARKRKVAKWTPPAHLSQSQRPKGDGIGIAPAPAPQAPASNLVEELHIYQRLYSKGISLKQGRERYAKELKADRERELRDKDKERNRVERLQGQSSVDTTNSRFGKGE